jgi:hypothetical protein
MQAAVGAKKINLNITKIIFTAVSIHVAEH